MITLKATMVIIGLLPAPFMSDLPSMEECIAQEKRLVEKLGSDVTVLCIPKENEISKQKEMFNMFFDLLEELPVSEPVCVNEYYEYCPEAFNESGRME